jgi:polysaccharide export outer membrane protein
MISSVCLPGNGFHLATEFLDSLEFRIMKGTSFTHVSRAAIFLAFAGSLAARMPQDNSSLVSMSAHGTAVNTAPKSRVTSDDYVIGAGDLLSISVWKEPDASVPSVVVRPDGKIAMPLLKDITVAGMTPAQAETMITQKLSPIIHDAEVTVVVTAINSKKVYVLGAVRKEGPIAYTYRMTALEAISEAGGLTEYAKRKKIYILRTENGQTTRLPFNYDQVIRGEKMEQNIQLLPGDTIVVSQ